MTLFLVMWMFVVEWLPVQAQDMSTGIAQVVEVKDTTITDGMVLCARPDGFVACDTPYAPEMYGVISENPAGYYEPAYEVQNGKYVLNSGIAPVKYVTSGEQLKKGDFVTTSETKGFVIKASENGYVLGVVVEDVQANASTVMVAINIHPETNLANTRSNLMAVLKEGTEAPILSPLDSLRYLIAALLIIASFIIGFVYFGRMASIGVEAMGRNPLAGKQIQFNMFLHIGITIVIVLAGMFLSYLILIV